MTARFALTGRKLIAVLRTEGFEVLRTRRSHHFLEHPDGRRTVVPVHAGETIGPGLLSKILRDCEISPSQMENLFRKLTW